MATFPVSSWPINSSLPSVLQAAGKVSRPARWHLQTLFSLECHRSGQGLPSEKSRPTPEFLWSSGWSIGSGPLGTAGRSHCSEYHTLLHCKRCNQPRSSGVAVTDIDLDALDYFRTDALTDDPYPYWDHLRSTVPGRPGVASRRLHGDRLPRGHPDLPRPGFVLELHLGHRALRQVPGPAGRRRPHRDHRDLPRQAALRRSAPRLRPAQAHRPPGSPDAVDHPQAAEGERGVHGGAGRPPDRPIPRPRASASSSASTPAPTHCWSSPICSECPRPTTRGSSRSSCTGPRCPWSTIPSSTSTNSSPPTSRSAGASPVRT